MVESLLIGGGFAFAAALQPGPLQAFLFSQVARRGFRAVLPAALAPLLSDGPIAVLAFFVLGRLPPAMGPLLRTAGGVLLLVLGWSAFRASRRQAEEAGSRSSAPGTLLQAVGVNLLNPNPYLAWTLVLGPAALDAWRRTPEDAVALLIAFYVTMVVTLAGTILLFGTTRLLGAHGRGVLVLLSAVALAALGVYQLAAGYVGWRAIR